MSGLPKVSIVGRPSVGKSTLFNRLVGRRQAIVADTPGVTRDVAEAVVSDVKDYLLRDTGGLASGDQWETPIHRQVERALADSELVLFLVDGRVSTTAADYEVAELLRRASKPVLLLATKIDDPRHAYYLGELWGLGFGEPIPISALHDQGIDELRQKITGLLPEGEGLDPAQPIKLAIMGRPNVGKSSLLNAIVGTERVIVSTTPGTTRDAIDTPFEFNGFPFLLIDTAGIRRQPRGDLEYYAMLRSREALARCDVAILVIDPFEMGDLELKLANEALDAGRALLLAINKWDLVPGRERAGFLSELKLKLAYFDFVPILCLSALTGAGVHDVLRVAVDLFQRWNTRVSTADLNRWLTALHVRKPPPTMKGRPLKIYYATQPATRPPTFIFFINSPDLVVRSYERFVLNSLREALDLKGVPVRIQWRGKGGERDQP